MKNSDGLWWGRFGAWSLAVLAGSFLSIFASRAADSNVVLRALSAYPDAAARRSLYEDIRPRGADARLLHELADQWERRERMGHATDYNDARRI